MKSQKVLRPKWKNKADYKDPIDFQPVTKLSESHPQLAAKNPLELFSLYYSDELRRLIIGESVKYARQKNNQQFTLDECQLDIFVAVLIFSVYHSLPCERMYWCRDEDVDVSFVSSRMSRKRFEDVKKISSPC